MRIIVLLCANGMSTSMMVKKMQTSAEQMGYDCQIEAHPIDEVKEYEDVDIILLGPQVKFQLNKIKSLVNCPVEVIDMAAYGTMNGSKVLEEARKVIGD